MSDNQIRNEYIKILKTAPSRGGQEAPSWVIDEAKTANIKTIKRKVDAFRRNQKKLSKKKGEMGKRSRKELEKLYIELEPTFRKKCEKKLLNDLYEIGTPEYKSCILSKGPKE